MQEYKNEYYNHFSKVRGPIPPQFNREENFMMRFKTQLPYYGYNENSLTIIYFKDGVGDLIVKDKKVKVDGNKFIVSNPSYGWEYFNKSEDYIDVLSFAISDDLIAKFNFFAFASEDQLLNVPLEKIEQKSFFLEKIYNADHYPSGRLLKSIHQQSCTDNYQYLDPKELTIEVLQAIYKDQFRAYLMAEKVKGTKSSTKIEVLKRLLVAYEYIHDNVEQKISIENLSHVSALSEYHLYNSFKKVFGKTPHQYALGLKMNRAEQYLRVGHLSISEIADLLQFPDLPSFSKLFKKTFGHSPANYLQQAS
ncbi:AraC family transcriptional regulator [Aquimarina sp. MMG016]|uniref:AraC family transcriptional regulator n=1 Tax=Aquimarina sp. MMG016 TaxID=2822690 RepID=UPI001B39FF0D|nr:AraC family transcriptional regulator [Aquimarina sp. MMG016]MBQ4819860.1 helix-turn-helix transcriptional regulator [Aquimarina sp. MMG016]